MEGCGRAVEGCGEVRRVAEGVEGIGGAGEECGGRGRMTGSMGRVADSVPEAYLKPVARSRPTLPRAASSVSSPDIHFARFMLHNVLLQDCSSFPVNWAGVGC